MTIDEAVWPRDAFFKLDYPLCEFSRLLELVWRWNCCSSCCSSPLATLAGRAPSSNFSRPHPSAERQKRAKQTWMDRLHGAIISFSFSRLSGFVIGGGGLYSVQLAFFKLPCDSGNFAHALNDQLFVSLHTTSSSSIQIPEPIVE